MGKQKMCEASRLNSTPQPRGGGPPTQCFTRRLGLKDSTAKWGVVIPTLSGTQPGSPQNTQQLTFKKCLLPCSFSWISPCSLNLFGNNKSFKLPDFSFFTRTVEITLIFVTCTLQDHCSEKRNHRTGNYRVNQQPLELCSWSVSHDGRLCLSLQCWWCMNMTQNISLIVNSDLY